jgi:hypothetical protein
VKTATPELLRKQHERHTQFLRCKIENPHLRCSAIEQECCDFRADFVFALIYGFDEQLHIETAGKSQDKEREGP